MFKRADWEKVGGLDEGMRFGFEDWDFWIQLVRDAGAKVRAINEPLFFYRIRKESMLRSTTSGKLEAYQLNFFLLTFT